MKIKELRKDLKEIALQLAILTKWNDKVIEMYVDQLLNLFTKRMGEERKKELKFLKRMKLEFDVVVCDCGDEWKDSDGAELVRERIKLLRQEMRSKLK